MNVVNALGYSRLGFREKLNYDIPLKNLVSEKHLMCIPRDDWPEESFDMVTSCQFSKRTGTEHILAYADDRGKVSFEDYSTKKATLLASFFAHKNAIFDISFCDVDDLLLSGSGDNTVSLWKIGDCKAQLVNSFKGHKGTVKSVCFAPHQPFLCASGGRDSKVLLWDSRDSGTSLSRKPSNVIAHSSRYEKSNSTAISKAGRSPISISSVLFQDSTYLFTCAVSDGVIRVWDLRRCYSANMYPVPVHTISVPSKTQTYYFSSLTLDPSGKKLFANCSDNNLYCYNALSYSTQPIAKFTGHNVRCTFVKCALSPDGKYLLSGSNDNNCYIWNTDRPGLPLVKLAGHTCEVHSVDWSRSSADIMISTCSDEFTDKQGIRSRPLKWYVDNDAKRRDKLDRYTTRCGRPTDPRAVYGPEVNICGWAEEDDEWLEKPLQRNRRHFTSRIQVETCSDKLVKDSGDNASLLASPTINLPNHVVDGTSPYHKCNRVVPEKEKNNWLSNVQVKTPPVENGRTSSGKKGQKRPRPPKSKVCGNLLRFFKVAKTET